MNKYTLWGSDGKKDIVSTDYSLEEIAEAMKNKEVLIIGNLAINFGYITVVNKHESK